MRSYETGLYDVSKDGNFQLHISRANPGDAVAFPKNSIGIDQFTDLGLTFLPMEYGINAYDTRSNFWKNPHNIEIISSLPEVDEVILDVSGAPSLWTDISYNFNITSHPLIKRPYIDEFLKRDVDSINKSRRTTVLNEWQKIWLIQNGALEGKIEVDQRVVNPLVLEKYTSSIDPVKCDYWREIFEGFIFFPFRISDSCYKFEKVLEMAGLLGMGVLITDPNESYKNDHFNVQKYVPTKEEYYTMLSAQPKIIYYEDPEFCFHPGLGELIYFDCEIISPFNIPSKDDILIKRSKNG